MSLAEKEAYAEKLEEKLRIRMIKIARYDQCVLIEIAATFIYFISPSQSQEEH
jgi:hypothetical protein